MQFRVYTATGMISVMDSAHRVSSAPSTRIRRLVYVAWFCAPLVLWLAVVAFASTNFASSAHTDVWLWRLLHPLSPGVRSGDSSGHFAALSWAVRKTAHLVVYGVLGLLAARALRELFSGYVRSTNREGLWRMAVVVLPFGALVASADELHQTLVLSRTGSLRDVATDMVGVSVGLLVLWLIGRRPSHRKRSARPSSPADPPQIHATCKPSTGASVAQVPKRRP